MDPHAADTTTRNNERPKPTRRIDIDLPCRECGYNLRGLQSAGQCPECGAAISRSLTDDQIANSSKKWLRVIRLGFMLMAVSLILRLQQVAIWFLGYWGFTYWPGRDWYLHLQWIAFGLGAWLVTTSEPGRQAIQRKTRRITRICIIVVAITGVVEESRLLNVDFWRAVAFFPFKHSFLLAGIVALLYHLHKLTLRLGQSTLPKQTKCLGIVGSFLLAMLLLSTLLNAVDLGIHQFLGSHDISTTMYQLHRTIFFLFYKLYTLFQLYLSVYFILILLAIRRETASRV